MLHNEIIVEQQAKPGYFYVRFAAAESDVARASGPVPGLGLGYRRLAGDGAADISLSGIGISSHRNSRFFWVAPKTSYFHYSSPELNESFYYGGGLAWGGVESEENRFVGIIPSITCGYEFKRKSPVLGFVEFNMSQPALAVYKSGFIPRSYRRAHNRLRILSLFKKRLELERPFRIKKDVEKILRQL